MSNEDFINLSATAKSAMLQRIDTRSMQTLLGICTGIIGDDVIQDKEIAFLKTWLLEHNEICDKWPANAIYFKVQEILQDGIITHDERQSLMTLLQQITGNYFADTGAAVVESPALPIDDDPSIYFRNMSFCFTGTFMYGTRAACERIILKLGAMPVDTVSKKLNYLVIGGLVTSSWVNESYGRKIEKAVQYRDQSGAELAIISERQWTEALIDAAR